MNITKMSKKTWVIVTLVALTTAGLSLLSGQTAQAQARTQTIQDCSENSIIKCGASSPADLIDKIRSGDANELEAVYSHFGLTPDRYDDFADNAKMGMAYRNGEIKVDGKVVARNAWSIGRSQKSYSQPFEVGGATYHRSDSTQVLRQDLPVMVLLDDQGKVEAAILAACGNPMGGDRLAPAKPTSTTVSKANTACRQLRAELINSDDTAARTNDKATYSFSVDTSSVGDSDVSRVVYDFGDGTTEERDDPADSVEHTYARAGSYTAKAIIYATGSDGREVAVNGSGCTKRITVRSQAPAKPATSSADWRCSSLNVSRKLNNGNTSRRTTNAVNTNDTSDGPVFSDSGDTDVTADDDDDGYLTYTLRANSSSSNARLSHADFDFGDGASSSRVEVEAADSNNISVDHTYSQPGTYTASATLYFEPESGKLTDGKDASASCEKSITITEPKTPVTPAAAVEPTPELPATGVAGAIGLFSGASAIGVLGFRWRLNRRISKINQMVDNLRQ